jgi:hypothetical protein
MPETSQNWSTRALNPAAEHREVPGDLRPRGLQRLVGDFVGQDLLFSLETDSGVIHGIDPFVRQRRQQVRGRRRKLLLTPTNAILNHPLLPL